MGDEFEAYQSHMFEWVSIPLLTLKKQLQMLFLNGYYHCIYSVWKTLLLHPLLDVVRHFNGFLVVSHYDFHCPNNWKQCGFSMCFCVISVSFFGEISVSYFANYFYYESLRI